MFCYGPLVSELGRPRVHGAPNPVIGGGAVPPAPRLRRLWYSLVWNTIECLPVVQIEDVNAEHGTDVNETGL